MIKRTNISIIKELFSKWPVVTVTGPRQSGKTTLCRSEFPALPYVSLEDPDKRAFALEDPRGFVGEYKHGAIFDEFQRVPELPSYLQRLIDESGRPGQYILTGSQQLEVMANVSQSLAGRTAVLKLLPFDFSEVSNFVDLSKLDSLLLAGFYPRVHDQKLNPTQAYAAYFETYIERDLRQLAAVRDLSVFQRFVRCCAARVGGLLNFNDLSNDVGVSHSTIREWISLLEASYILFLHRPWFTNTTKRLTKSHKVFFYDVGLASYLLGIEDESHVKSHPLRGSLFENMIVIEVLKQRYNAGLLNNLYFYRDSNHVEIDLLIERGAALSLVEIKSASTPSSAFTKTLKSFKTAFPELEIGGGVVYNGEPQNRTDWPFVNYKNLDKLIT